MSDSVERSRPELVDESCNLIENIERAPLLWDMELRAPRIARTLQPGQFVHMKVPGMDGAILRRPFSVYHSDPETATIRILYQLVGRGSTHMSTLNAASCGPIRLIGPVGRRWTLPEGARRVLFVAGGVGAAPLAMFGRELVQAGVSLDVCMGAQTRGALVLKEHYEQVVGVKPICATDDGSFGHAGFVTEPAAEMLERTAYDLVCCCGPEPLMRIVAGMTADAGVACQVSLEKRMACGVGACLSCVVDTVDGKKRSCVDGPVFDARKVVW